MNIYILEPIIIGRLSERIMLMKLYECRGEEAVPLERYETVTVDNFLGSAYTKTLSKDLENNPDTIQIYLPLRKPLYEVFREHPKGSRRN